MQAESGRSGISPGYPDPYAAGAEIREIPSEIVSLDPGLRTARLLHYSLAVEHQLWRKSSWSAAMSWARRSRLYRSRDANSPLAPDFIRPDPTLGTVRHIESSGRMAAKSLELAWRGEIASAVQGTVIYELSFRV